jgi:hypothetical protein
MQQRPASAENRNSQLLPAREGLVGSDPWSLSRYCVNRRRQSCRCPVVVAVAAWKGESAKSAKARSLAECCAACCFCGAQLPSGWCPCHGGLPAKVPGLRWIVNRCSAQIGSGVASRRQQSVSSGLDSCRAGSVCSACNREVWSLRELGGRKKTGRRPVPFVSELQGLWHDTTLQWGPRPRKLRKLGREET